MPNLNIPFPEGARRVLLRGTRITIGRLPENTIQILDRTVSAYHAELISEGGHYRLHDVGATNGVLVNGRQITDFHLHEGCTIRLGTVECKFYAEEPAPDGPDEINPLPSRGETNAVRQENAELKAQVEQLREQLQAMTGARQAAAGAINGVVPLEEFDRLAAERAALQEARRRALEDYERLNASLAVMRRDRDNLEQACNDLRAASQNAQPPPALLATPASAVSNPPESPPSRLPKPPVPLSGSTPSRRPASAVSVPPARSITPPARVPVAAGTGPRGTQKLVP